MKYFAFTILMIWCSGFLIAAEPVDVDYLRDVRPILAKHCYGCHGATAQKSDLRLDTADAIRTGGSSGPAIEPGSSEASLLIEALTGAEGVTQMPFKRSPLSKAEIQQIKAWIDAGAKSPANEIPQSMDEQESGHWSFQPLVRPDLPVIKNLYWTRNPIDRFVLARLEAEGIATSPEADRVTLIRRLSLDLVGLPPSPEEVDAFLADVRPDAYEHLVDRLLQSPHFGERWARHWLDAARYADSNGFSIDAPRSMWQYRDWVINALNNDMPFDQFAIEQIAGDLLPEATQSQKIATGFHRNTLINQEGGIDKEQFRIESLVDRVNTTGTVFLGLTIGCAQCHDHKFDPIEQQEYYELFAFFNSVDEPDMEIASPEQFAQRSTMRTKLAEMKKEQKNYAESMASQQETWEKNLLADARQKLSDTVRTALGILPDDRDEKQKKLLFKTFMATDAGYRKQQSKMDALTKRVPKFPTTMVMRERKQTRETRVYIQGDFTRPDEQVFPGVPAVLPPLPPEVENPTRLDLATWLASPENPLTPRVTVNRIWQQYFGHGIVETENDFGVQGSPPSHPQLLDWLAAEFIESGWSMKAIHRLIVTSATYRQASHARPELAEVDPSNRGLARQNRLRLDAEIIRDSALTASGLLATKIGGPSVYPPQPEGVMTLGQMKRSWTTSTGDNRFRRGMYTFFWRATPYPALTVFNAPNATTACTRRDRSNTPLQALTLLNDASFFEIAQGLAIRIVSEAPDEDRERIRYAFRLCLAREPQPNEMQQLTNLVEQFLTDYRADPQEAARIVSKELPKDVDAETSELAAWTSVSRVLLNLDEFITRE